MVNINESLAKGGEYTRNAALVGLGLSIVLFPGLFFPSLFFAGGGEYVKRNREEAAKKGGGIFP